MLDNSIAIELPFPPSVNTYWRTFRGRMIISAKGREYREYAIACIGRTTKREGRLRVSLVLYPPDKRRRDIDNYSKALLDAMTHAGAWEDDSQIDELLVRRGEIRKDGAVEVFVDELEPST